MRTLFLGLASLLFLIVAAPASAQDRYCVGSCDRYGNPIDERGLNPRYDLPRYDDDYYNPPRRYRDRRYNRRIRGHAGVSIRYSSRRRTRGYYQPDYSEFYPENRYYGHEVGYRERRTYRRSYREHRRYRETRRYRRTYRKRRTYRRSYVGRTKFCRMETHRNSHGWGKTKVRRCVYVRNDLLGNPHLRRSRHDW